MGQRCFLEAMILCLFEEIELAENHELEWLKEYKMELATQAIPVISGGMSLHLEEYLIEEERKSVVISFCQSIVTKIEKTDSYLTGKNLHQLRRKAMTLINENDNSWSQLELDELVNDSRWQESRIANIKNGYAQSFILLISLISGEMKTTVSSPQSYWSW